MDKELPWLADNAQLELKYKKGKTPLSHRNWPGEPVPVITESIIQTLGDELLQKAEKKKNIVWRYENFSLEWQSTITQAINLIGEHKPSVPARTMAVLACIAQKDSQQLLDEIVQQEGLEYATEVVIARQFIARCYENDPLVVTLPVSYTHLRTRTMAMVIAQKPITNSISDCVNTSLWQRKAAGSVAPTNSLPHCQE